MEAVQTTVRSWPPTRWNWAVTLCSATFHSTFSASRAVKRSSLPESSPGRLQAMAKRPCVAAPLASSMPVVFSTSETTAPAWARSKTMVERGVFRVTRPLSAAQMVKGSRQTNKAAIIFCMAGKLPKKSPGTSRELLQPAANGETLSLVGRRVAVKCLPEIAPIRTIAAGDVTVLSALRR